MKTNTLVKAALESDHDIRAIPEATIDWNMNRFIGAVADNNPKEEDEGYEVEIFPIESIIANNRPTKGINKARVGQAVVGDDYRMSTQGVSSGKYYVADQSDTYKYWTSPDLSSSTGTMARCMPQVIYKAPVKINKVVITTENSWASASTFSIQASTNEAPTDTVNSTNWVEIANQSTVGTAWKASGQIVLYYTGNGTVLNSFSTAGRVDNADLSPKTVEIRALRIVVTALEGGYKVTDDKSLQRSTYIGLNATGGYSQYTTNGKDSHFDLIEISGRLEFNLTPYIMETSSTFDFSENSSIYPIGTVTSNNGTITLSNLYKNSAGKYVPGLFSKNNTDSPYYKYIEANAEVNLVFRFFDEDNVALGTVQEFNMFVDTWTGQADEAVSMSLSDYSKFFNTAEATLASAMWEDLTVPQIIWRIMDSIGFTKYHIDYGSDNVTEHTIPVFYTDGESNVWEVLDDIAKAAQAAVYFDAYGVLQVKTRDFAFSPANAAVWKFSSTTTPSKLADIATLDLDTEFEPNYFKVTYQSTDWEDVVREVPKMQQVWEPEGTVTLRASAMVRDLETTSTWFWIPAADVKYWPYKGIVNIQGELIKYEGKIFVYYTGATGATRNTAKIKSQDDLSKFNSKTPVEYRHKNNFTGALAITERGVWNSETKRHAVEAEGYNVRQISAGNRKLGVPGFTQDSTRSRVTIVNGSNFKDRRDIKIATRGETDDLAFYHYGTRMRFIRQAGRTNQCAGLVIHNQNAGEDGYYFELTPSAVAGGANKGTVQEVLVYARNGGKDKILARGAIAIAENIDYEMDIKFTPLSGQHRLQCWINGQSVANVVVTSSDVVAQNGKFGMFIRGNTRAEFEYLYAIRREEEPGMLEDFSLLDKVERAYTGNQWDREWVYRWREYKKRVKRKSVKARMRYNRQFFDEFGPIVHEVREFDVKFDPAPILHSRLYMSNDWSGCAIEYESTPFGATFVIANTSRKNAVLHGEDTISFSGTGDSIDQILTVFGRVLVMKDAEEVLAKNDDQIRIRGKNESEISSPWIQSKQQAQDLADWINANFSYGNEKATIEVFGNPLIELGDVVNVLYPQKHINSDFFVIGVSNNFANGISTTLTLRRRQS